MGEAVPKRVVIVGRPNVGKSTLFNRLVGRRQAIVHERPGVTRDLLEGLVQGERGCFVAVDSGGIASGASGLASLVSQRALEAVCQADLVLFVVDALSGATPEDERLAAELRKVRHKVVLVANKCDGQTDPQGYWSLLGLGWGAPRKVSALHNRGVEELIEEVMARLGRSGNEPLPEAVPVAIVGRPNVGKSTLFNALVAAERSIVSDTPGTTRDTVDCLVTNRFGAFRFLDTAGLRRRARVEDEVERFARIRSEEAIGAAVVVLLVADATEGITRQDKRLASLAEEKGRALVVLVNKIDLLSQEDRAELLKRARAELSGISHHDPLAVSAKERKGLARIWPMIARAAAEMDHRIPTGEFNRFLREALASYPHPPRVKYGTQVDARPPRFVLFGSDEAAPSFVRFLQNRIRARFDIRVAPLPIEMRRG
jgi:GTP-binding protein